MDTQTQDQLKNALLTEKTRLEDQLDRIGTKNSNDDYVVTGIEDDGSRADSNENADDVELFENRVATLNELEIRYAEVKRALKKIEVESYGICEISGEKIEIERLLANPSARTNIAHMHDFLPEIAGDE